jgi:hypothetical protein
MSVRKMRQSAVGGKCGMSLSKRRRRRSQTASQQKMAVDKLHTRTFELM